MTKIKRSQKLRYRFDNTMSKGPGALILWLAILTMSFIIVATLVLLAFSVHQSGSDDSLSTSEAFWQTLMHAMDPGTVAGDVGWAYRLVMFIVTLGGIFILSTLIGILSSGIDEKLQDLRKGRSFVVEKDHQLILGWNSKVFTIIDELVLANENQLKPRIVVMAREDKTMMEDAIRDKCPDLKNTKVICRSGDPNDVNDLHIVNINDSKSIVVLSEEEAADSDAQTIKTLLAIMHHPHRADEPFHVVAEMHDQKNIQAGHIVGKDEVELLLTDDLVSRIMVQTCRQSGLSVVYTELTGFDGDEIYIMNEPAAYGKTFGEMLFQYNDSSLIGIQFPDSHVVLNPAMDTPIEAGCKLVAITADDDTLIMNASNASISEEFIQAGQAETQEIERTLLLCWNKKGPSIVREIAAYVPAGSELLIVSNQENVANEFSKLALSDNLKIEVQVADPSDRTVLEQLKVDSFSQIIVLANNRQLSVQEADSQTLITLLHLRDIIDQNNANVRIVSEIMDVRNRELASVTKADDFVVSDKLISQLVSQVSESKDLVKVFADMFDADSSEIYLRPMSDYVKPGIETDFYTVLESAKRQGHTAIGYRLTAHQYNKEQHYGIVLNPMKSRKISFSENDKVIVFAEG